MFGDGVPTKEIAAERLPRPVSRVADLRHRLASLLQDVERLQQAALLAVGVRYLIHPSGELASKQGEAARLRAELVMAEGQGPGEQGTYRQKKRKQRTIWEEVKEEDRPLLRLLLGIFGQLQAFPVMREGAAQAFEQAIADLRHEKKQRIIRLRYGFEDGSGHTLEACGKALGITRQRVLQLEANALRSLEVAVGAEPLRGYLMAEESNGTSYRA